MSKFGSLEKRFTESLGLTDRPVGILVLDKEPKGIPKFDGQVPAGCAFWRLALERGSFYTVPGDHYNCAVGSYTHGISLPDDRAGELPQTLTMMQDAGYLRAEEVPGIPTLQTAPAAIAYGPLGELRDEPSVVVFRVAAYSAMLLGETLGRVDDRSATPLWGRPTCMAVPGALRSGAVASLGCIGNRTYTSLDDDRLYLVISGSRLAEVADALVEVVCANKAMAEYAAQRLNQLPLS